MHELAASPFPRTIAIDDVPANGLRDQIEAAPGERMAMAELLGLEALAELRFDFTLMRRGSNHFALDGVLRAQLTQACVVSLAPIDSAVTLPIEARFWPDHELAASDRGQDEVQVYAESDAPEPIIEGRIEIGQLVYEHFASHLDPYPRKADARIAWHDDTNDAEAARSDNPFAVLKSLKGSS